MPRLRPETWDRRPFHPSSDGTLALCRASPCKKRPDTVGETPCSRLSGPCCSSRGQHRQARSPGQGSRPAVTPRYQAVDVDLDIAENSGSEGVLDDLEALPNHRVVADADYLAAAWLDQQTGPLDELIAQGPDILKRSDRPPFAIRGTPLRGAGLHGPHQVKGKDTEHLPCAVGAVAQRRQAIVREAGLGLSVDLLVGAAPAHEEPWGRSSHFLVRSDGRVLEVAIVRIEEIKFALYRSGGWRKLDARKRGSRPPNLNARAFRWIYDTVLSTSPLQLKFPFALWTAAMVGQVIARRFGVRLSHSSVFRLLSQMGMSAQRPLWRAYQQDPDAVRRWKQENYPRLRRRAQRLGAQIF